MVGSVHGVPNSWTWLNDFTFTFKEAQKGVTLRLKVDITEHFNYSEWVKDIDPALNLPASTIHSIYKQRILKAAKVALGSTSSKVVFFCSWHTVRNTMGFPDGSASKDSACNAGDIGDTSSISGSERSSGEGNDNTLQYSCLGNPMDRGAWRTIYSAWGHKRGRHDLATKRQQQLLWVAHRDLTQNLSGSQL